MLARTTLFRLALPVALALPLALRSAPPAGPGLAWPDSPGGQLVFFAVLEGLYTDGVQPEVVRAVLRGPPDAALAPDEALTQPAAQQAELARTLFVPGCPLCTPALVAFETYAARGPLHVKDWTPDGRPRDSFGPGLPDELLSRLQSRSRADRLAALQCLITSWIARRLNLGRATETEREQFRIWIEEGRKRGMQQLGAVRKNLDAAAAASWPRCASCDGAVEGCTRR